MHVCIVLKPGSHPDSDLSLVLERGLLGRGHTVFVDRQREAGLAWAQRRREELEHADLIVALVSAHSARSEMFAYEIELADDAARARSGRLVVMPVRLGYRGPLSEELANLLRHYEFEWDPEEERYRSHAIFWNSPADDATVLDQICRQLEKLASHVPMALPAPTPPRCTPVYPLESVGGAVPLDSKYYIVRATDGEFHAAIQRQDSIVLVKGARQMGKTSLLGRALQQARNCGFRIVLTDLQKLQAAHFDSVGEYYAGLCELIALQLDVDPPPRSAWNGHHSANAVFEQFWRNDILKHYRTPVLWASDEFDRVLSTGFGVEVCALLRAWHNDRVLDPEGPWRWLTIGIAYATEAHLFITDLNQSPFNVGTRLTLQDFSPAEVAELNRRYGAPLLTDAELDRFYRLLGGQPYLVRSAMHEMVTQNGDIRLVEEMADSDEGVFGDHLRRLLLALSCDEAFLAAARGLLRGEPPPTRDIFYRLRSGGIIVGNSPQDTRWRCDLYARYLRRHLE